MRICYTILVKRTTNTPFKLFLYTLLLCLGCIGAAQPAHASSHTDGRILLQVEARGEAWYVDPVSHTRRFLGRPSDAYEIMRSLGLGITNANLDKIPKRGTAWDGDHSLMQHVRGRVLLQVESRGEAWYVNPADGKRYYLGQPEDALRIMSSLGLGITNSDLANIPMASGPMETMKPVPDPVFLSVPFQPQAPHGNWGQPYNEACEEAILVMLEYYFRGQELSAETADAEIKRLVNWEVANYGYYEDTNVEQTGRVMEANYGRRYRVSSDVSIQTIISELHAGHPVVAPVSGRDLGNPHFTGLGPIYHMVLIVGYENGSFITHDPGTRYGAFYRYDANRLISVIHNLTTPESSIRCGDPAYLVIY